MKIEKAFISFRIHATTWLSDASFNELLALFEKYKDVADELTFFTSETHPCLPLDVIRKRAGLLARRMDQARLRGYRAGINLLSTVGHHNENLSDSLTGDYTPMTDIEGKVCLGSLCPNDENLRTYVRDVYRALAEARPDHIWIDDDVRLFGHMPIAAACFCDNCLAIYERESGRRHSRGTLQEAFNSGTVAERLENRKSWLAHNRKTIARLFELIERTVHAVNPALPLGFMTGERFFEGYDFDTWAGILAGPGHAEVMWRPGGGFYSDEALVGLIEKSHQIGRQVSLLPDSLRSIQSEIENFPHQRLKKSAHVTALEAASHIAAGCTGTAFNVLQPYDEPLDEYEPLVAELSRARPFYDVMAKILGRSRPQGLWGVWSKDSFAANGLTAQGWPDRANWGAIYPKTAELHELGIPAAYDLAHARIAALTADAARAMTEAELKTILSRGVCLDGPALERLNEMGYGEHTGFSVVRYHEADCIEELLPDDLNRTFAGRMRDCRQSFAFWNVPAAELKPESAAARPISRLIDYGGKEVAACASGVFENRLGGRVFVAGYFPWTYLQSFSKASQLKSVLRWLSGDKLPGYVASYHKINLWVRDAGEGRPAAALVNASLDPARDVELMLLTNSEQIEVRSMAGDKSSVRASGSDGSYMKFVLPPIAGWHMLLIEI